MFVLVYARGSNLPLSLSTGMLKTRVKEGAGGGEALNDIPTTL